MVDLSAFAVSLTLRTVIASASAVSTPCPMLVALVFIPMQTQLPFYPE